ncbi:MAG: ABC transporter permease, partial [Planctomycetaceae bacterium]
MFQVIRTIELALKSLMLHKLRSGLTVLGIVFGVFSVIAMLAIGEGASQQAQDQVLELGANNIIVRAIKPPQESQNTGQRSRVLRYGLLRSDYRLLSRTIPTVINTIPIREIRKESRYLHRVMSNSRIVGCTADYVEVNHLGMSRGRFISEQDNNTKANVAVLANGTAETLFKADDPLGKAVKINNEYYRIIGITKPRTASAAIGGSMSGQDFNKDIYIPLKTFQSRLGDLIFNVQPGSFSAEQVELNQITLQVKDDSAVVGTAEVVRETLKKTHRDKEDYAVVVPLELLKQAQQIKMIFNVVLGSIAAISLVVGGIGIMNIMLATVTERTREIGVRRALGAKQWDIVRQFLTETIVLAGSGGVIGILLGLATPYIFLAGQWVVSNYMMDSAAASGGSEFSSMFGELVPIVRFWSVPLAFGISVFIGLISGLYPAWAAARLDP